MEKNSLFVIIPTLNEEKNILPTVEKVQRIVPKYFSTYSILVLNDGSTDQTGRLADELAEKCSHLKVIHHDRPMGLGYAYKLGVKLSQCEYFIMVSGDNEEHSSYFEEVFSHAGQRDIIIPYTANPEVRPLMRRLMSKLFVTILNLLFHMRLRYYNGCVLHRTEIINSIAIKTDSYAYQAEALIKLIRRGHTYKEVGVDIQPRVSGKSKAFRWKNVLSVIKAIPILAKEIYFDRK